MDSAIRGYHYRRIRVDDYLSDEVCSYIDYGWDDE